MSPTTYPLHPYAKIFPLIEGAAFDELVADIKEHGIREPLVLHAGALLDGRNRLRACELLGIAPPTKEWNGDDPLAYVVSANLRRRHLRDSQRALVAARLANCSHGGAKDRAFANDVISRSRAAQLLNVKERMLQWGRQADKSGVPAVLALVESGRLSISAAGKVSNLTATEQTKLAAEGPAAIVARVRKLDRLKGRQGRSEYAILWRCVDDICAALEGARLDKAHSSATKLLEQIARIVGSRRSVPVAGQTEAARV